MIHSLSYAQKSTIRIQSYHSDSSSNENFDKTFEFDANNSSDLQILIDSAIGNANFYFKQFDLSNENINMDSLLGSVFNNLSQFENLGNFENFFSQQDLFPSFEQKAFLGVYFEDNEENDQNKLGVYISKVIENSAAEIAGLTIGDKIIQIDDKEIYVINDAIDYIKNKKSGENITITFERDNKINITTATLLSNIEATALNLMPELDDITYSIPNIRGFCNKSNIEDKTSSFGLKISDLDDESRKDLKVKKNNGVLVTDVFPQSLAEQMGLKTNDVVTSINGQNIHNKESLNSYLSSFNNSRIEEVKIIRYGKSKSLKGFISEQ
jgi:C-terminal processing protease CtpA/Prc